MANVTIQDVADHAGVSIKTVSRVVNKEPSVSPLTKDKVLSSIAALGYSPSQAARGLAGNKSFLLGLLYYNPSAAYVLALQEGVLQACEEEGFYLLIQACEYTSRTMIDDIIHSVRRSRLDGLVLSPPLSDNKALIDALKNAGVHFVCVSHQADNSCISVHSSEMVAVRDLVRHLISLGHKDIAIIVGHPQHGASQIRLQGFKEAMAEAGFKIKPAFVQQGMFTFESGVECGHRLLTMAAPPTAIFASNDYMAAGVMKAASRLGVLIPKDLSLAGFDDVPVASQLWPSLTTIRQPLRKMGRMAAELLIAKIRSGDNFAAPALDEMACELIIRETTASSSAT